MIVIYKLHYNNNRLRSDYFTGKNYITERKRALRYIHSRILYVRVTVRVGAMLRCSVFGVRIR